LSVTLFWARLAASSAALRASSSAFFAASSAALRAASAARLTSSSAFFAASSAALRAASSARLASSTALSPPGPLFWEPGPELPPPPGPLFWEPGPELLPSPGLPAVAGSGEPGWDAGIAGTLAWGSEADEAWPALGSEALTAPPGATGSAPSLAEWSGSGAAASSSDTGWIGGALSSPALTSAASKAADESVTSE
jgi:hypothetical protein